MKHLLDIHFFKSDKNMGQCQKFVGVIYGGVWGDMVVVDRRKENVNTK